MGDEGCLIFFLINFSFNYWRDGKVVRVLWHSRAVHTVTTQHPPHTTISHQPTAVAKCTSCAHAPVPGNLSVRSTFSIPLS